MGGRGGALLAVIVVAAILGGGLDVQVLSEAAKSLDYRFEYWQATLDLVAHYPILGVGPGEFQDYYTQFKLPEASEEVRDPHNFLLEIWASGGTLALLAITAVLAGFGWHVWEQLHPAPESPEGTAPSPAKSANPTDRVPLVVAGTVVALPLAFCAGLPFGFYLSVPQMVIALVIGGAMIAALWRWIASGTMPARLAAIALLVLSIHWLAAGGLSFPGVADTFWILLALGLNGPAGAVVPRAAKSWWRRLLPSVALGITVSAAVGCYFSALLPVMRCRAEMIGAANPRLNDQARIAGWLRAVAADAFAVDPWIEMARLAGQRALENPDDALWRKRLLTAVSSVIALRGHSSATWNEMAELFRAIYDKAPSEALAERILQLSRGAAYLYPNSARLQAEYGLALAQAGDDKDARRVAGRALELDELTPHADKKLSRDLKRRIEALLAEVPAGQPSPAEPPVVE